MSARKAISWRCSRPPTSSERSVRSSTTPASSDRRRGSTRCPPNAYVDYAASKGAVDSFTIGLGHEVAGEGIRVAAIRPGLIDTEIHASGGEPDRAHRLSHMVPMQRVGTANEIANAIVWLMSDDASYVTSAILDVSGGR